MSKANRPIVLRDPNPSEPGAPDVSTLAWIRIEADRVRDVSKNPNPPTRRYRKDVSGWRLLFSFDWWHRRVTLKDFDAEKRALEDEWRYFERTAGKPQTK